MLLSSVKVVLSSVKVALSSGHTCMTVLCRQRVVHCVARGWWPEGGEWVLGPTFECGEWS